MRIECTRSCGQARPLLLLLEELDQDYELEIHPEGHFLATYGRPGPRLSHGELVLFDLLAMLRYCARTSGSARLVPSSAGDEARIDGWLERCAFIGWTLVALWREERDSWSCNVYFPKSTVSLSRFRTDDKYCLQ
jgi:glutathione S-transferase